eukprot:2068439-Pleurochrysis_carterae.AAC.2
MKALPASPNQSSRGICRRSSGSSGTRRTHPGFRSERGGHRHAPGLGLRYSRGLSAHECETKDMLRCGLATTRLHLGLKILFGVMRRVMVCSRWPDALRQEVLHAVHHSGGHRSRVYAAAQQPTSPISAHINKSSVIALRTADRRLRA